MRKSHIYLRKADCSTHISVVKPAFNKAKVLVVGTKQSRQVSNRLHFPDYPVSLPAWAQCYKTFYHGNGHTVILCYKATLPW
jgi:hypothetical protein